MDHDVIYLVAQIMCNLWTRNNFQTKSDDQVNDITNQLFLSRGIPNVSLNLKDTQGLEIYRYICLHMKIICRKFYIITAFTF